MQRVRCGASSGRDHLVRIGPCLDVQVGFDPRFHQPVGRPNIPDERRVALIDTGASTSCIDEDLAESLGLPSHERDSLTGVIGEPYDARRFTAHLYLPDLAHVYHWEFSGLPLKGRLRDCHLLIGRDLLAFYRLQYDGPAGTVHLETSR